MITSSSSEYKALINELYKKYPVEEDLPKECPHEDFMNASYAKFAKSILEEPDPALIDVINKSGLEKFKVGADYICNTLYKAVRRHGREMNLASLDWEWFLQAKLTAAGKKISLEDTEDMRDIAKSMYELMKEEKISDSKSGEIVAEVNKRLINKKDFSKISSDKQVCDAYMLHEIGLYVRELRSAKQLARQARLEKEAKTNPAGYFTINTLELQRPQSESGCQIL